MKNPKTYFQKYNRAGIQSGREAITASHPVLQRLIGIVNEQQNRFYVNKEKTDLFTYNTIWIPRELHEQIEHKYHGSSFKDSTKRIDFYIGSKLWSIAFRIDTMREQDIKDIEAAAEARKQEETERKKKLTESLNKTIRL